MFLKRETDLNFTRTPFCVSYVHFEQHSKFQQRSNRGVFVGYSKDVPGSYVIWQPDENKTKLSAHVTCMEKLKEDGTLLHPAHIFYPELARTKVSKSACVFNIGTKIGPGGRRIAKTSVPHAPSTNLLELGGEPDTHSQKTTHSALDYAFATDVSETPGFEPRTYEEAIHSKDHERWILAIDSELNSHQLNGTWIVIDNDGTVKNLIGCKWVFKIKLNSDGSIARYKARLVAQGFSQIHGVDYSETYAPVVQYQTLRTLLAIYSARGFYFGQIDVETAYLYALVQELIYMRPPKGTNYGPNKICRLLKSLYGLKQAGRNWYLDLKDYLVELGFKPGEVDIGMYSAAVGTENEIWILVYVDDIIFASKNEQTKDILAGHLRKKYRITEPAQLTWALGMKISFAADGIILTQDLYMSKILERFGFTSAAKSATTPLAHGTTLTRADEEDAEARHLAQQFVGAILYAAVISRPDLSSTVRAMSHVMSKPPSNFEACKKHVLRYLSGTINRGIKYNTNSNVPLKLIGYCDASWGDNHENRRSTSGYIFFLNGGPISWASYLQTTVALSTVESEVMALTEAIKEAIYIRRLLESLGAAQEGPTIIYTDSTDAAKMQTVQLHTLTTLRCVMRLAARVTTQHVGAATPTQAAEVAVDEADIKVAEADEEDDTRCTTDASHHGIGGTQQYLPPPPPLPSQLMQNNIARVGEAFPTMNAPPPTGQMYQTGPYRRTFAITLATNEPNCSKYIVDNASPYTLTGSLNHLYDVQQLEKPKEIGGIKKDSTIKCTHVGKIDFTTHEGTLTVSNAYYGFYFGQIDVETAYLYALVQELIYMRPPKGTNYGPNKICRLLKSLYGLKQAGRNWYLDLKDYLVELGFKPGEVDIGMYSAAVGTENEIWILVYVDDIIFASKNEQTKDIFAGHLRKKYRITEPAQLTWALGMKISFAADGIILTQDLYMSKILERFGFTSAAKSATTPLAHGTTLTRADEEDAEARHLAQQFVGAILYAAVISRPDLSSTVRAMSHVMSKPPSNFEACKKHVLRYLSGTINRGIKYNTNSNVPLKLIGYCDASWGDNHENRRSTSGYIFFLNGGPISWASYLQTTVALSTVESEVMALTEAIKEAIYIRRLLESLGAAQEGPTIIYTDSTGAEALVDHPTSHRRTKHIEIRREFIKFHIGHETVKIERVSTKDQLADIMTKPLRQDIHNYLVQMILHG
ncbi:retrovirus-related Pol polyprotein [Pseudoscourfieldia marina]